MNFMTNLIDEQRATRAGTSDAAAGVDASNIERLLDSWSGPVQRIDPENDLAQRRASFEAQRARIDLAEVEGERRRQEFTARSTPVSLVLIMLALVVLFGIEVVGASIMLEAMGVPLRHRLAAAIAYAVGLVVVTRITGWLVEVRKPGPLGWFGAAFAIVMYAGVIVLGAAARFLTDENDLSIVDLMSLGGVACLCVFGPAISMHFAIAYYLRAHPIRQGQRTMARREATLLRTLKSSHATLDRAQSAARDAEVRRVQMKAAYLAAHRRELARIASLAQLNESLTKTTTETEPERKK